MKKNKITSLVDVYEQACFHQFSDDELLDLFADDLDLEKLSQTYFGLSKEDSAKRFRAYGRLAIRMNQFKLSEKNASMAIFLGKQYLGQTEKIETTFNAKEINEMNKKIMESVAECRNIEEFEKE